MLKLGYVGGLGHMAAPSAGHLAGDSPASVVRVHDRGASGAVRNERREAWRSHGADLVGSLEDLIGSGDLDGVVVCCGKNGDDLSLVGEVIRRLGVAGRPGSAVLHMSTVSAGFAEAAHRFAADHGVAYANYPLTGGPLGAQRGGAHPQGMLILASGDRAVYDRWEPVLKRLGHPRFFGDRVAAGAETKLIGQHMVFCGCTGITTAAALHAECFANGVLGGDEQSAYFDFLNGGAGGTRQWDVALSKGVREGVWEAGFMLRHAVVDAVYAARLAMDRGLPRFSVQPMLTIAFAFSYLLREYPDQELATHAVARELIAARADGLDAFLREHGAWAESLSDALAGCVSSLPDAVRGTVRLDVAPDDFTG